MEYNGLQSQLTVLVVFSGILKNTGVQK